MDTPDLTRAQWHTSTYSGGNGSCIEVARNLPGLAAVRDSKDRQGPKLVLQRTSGTASSAASKPRGTATPEAFLIQITVCPGLPWLAGPAAISCPAGSAAGHW